MIHDIMAVAKAFAGVHLPDEEAAVLQTLCEESFIRWGNRLLPDITPENCADALIPACACTALAGLAALRGAAGGDLSFRAGDVSIERESGGGSSLSDRLNRQAEALMAPYVASDRFAFRAVKG